MTYIGTGEGWLFLSSVLDLGSRHLLGWQMDDNMATPLVADALSDAVRVRGGDVTGVIFHSDRGSSIFQRSTGLCAVCSASGSWQVAW